MTETPQFCSVNSTSSDLALLTDSDNLTVSCRLSYFPATHWVPYIQCLPDVPDHTELIDHEFDHSIRSGHVTYSKSFSAAPGINDNVLRCFATFDATDYKARSGLAHNAPQDVLLWKSAPLQVQCKQQFRAKQEAKLSPG